MREASQAGLTDDPLSQQALNGGAEGRGQAGRHVVRARLCMRATAGERSESPLQECPALTQTTALIVAERDRLARTRANAGPQHRIAPSALVVTEAAAR
ncbi:hypothetical protein [Streptomyces flaveolus]|uniref:hypothetical protein n=1 Tax=Streptomyces flaveolus TaxID=67297 RepID=UPI0036F9BB37